MESSNRNAVVFGFLFVVALMAGLAVSNSISAQRPTDRWRDDRIRQDIGGGVARVYDRELNIVCYLRGNVSISCVSVDSFRR